jgi:exopolysaccharide biosynthesis predicted pyruvyltransferase EpsI
MVMNSRCFRRMTAGLVALLAVGALASCGPMATSPQQVQSSNPTVTYNYRTDQELVQANRNATTFCAQYQTTPRTANITNNPDGSRAVVFECVRTTSAPPAPPAAPSQSYTYRTDQELVQASQAASAYCMSYGSQPMTSTIVINLNGTKTVTFQCGVR